MIVNPYVVIFLSLIPLFIPDPDPDIMIPDPTKLILPRCILQSRMNIFVFSHCHSGGISWLIFNIFKLVIPIQYWILSAPVEIESNEFSQFNALKYPLWLW